MESDTRQATFDAMLTSLGKRKTQIIVVGTLAPAPLTGPASFGLNLFRREAARGVTLRYSKRTPISGQISKKC